jgi:hypothetical protein
LPGLFERLRIRCLTGPRDWNAAPQKMMQTATTHIVGSGCAALMILTLLALFGYRVRDDARSAALVRALESAGTEHKVPLVDELRSGSERALARLDDRWTDPSLPRSQRWKLGLVRLPGDDSLRQILLDKIVDSELAELNVVCDCWMPYAGRREQRQFAASLWDDLRNSSADARHRLRLAFCLATLDPKNELWEEAAQPLVETLIKEPPWKVVEWLHGLHLVKWSLQSPFEDVFFQTAPGADRTAAATALGEFLAAEPDQLVELIKLAQPRELTILVERIDESRADVIRLLEQELAQKEMEIVTTDLAMSRLADFPTELRELLETAHGIVAPQFAYCPSLKITDLIQAVDGLRAVGYRPIRCRPYRADDEIVVAAVWTKGKLSWKFEFDLTEDALRKAVTGYQAEGLRLLDVASYHSRGA